MNKRNITKIIIFYFRIILLKFKIKNSEPFNGVVFVKNKYETCRVEVEKSDSATLVLGLPRNFGMKPILLNGDSSNTKVKTSSKVEVGGENGNNQARISSGGDHGVSANEVRQRRQSERDCGLQDMVIIFKRLINSLKNIYTQIAILLNKPLKKQQRKKNKSFIMKNFQIYNYPFLTRKWDIFIL